MAKSNRQGADSGAAQLQDYLIKTGSSPAAVHALSRESLHYLQKIFAPEKAFQGREVFFKSLGFCKELERGVRDLKFLSDASKALEAEALGNAAPFLIRLVAGSPFLVRWLTRFPQWWPDLRQEITHPKAYDSALYLRAWNNFLPPAMTDAVQRLEALRTFHAKEILRIAFRELNQLAPLEVTARELAFLAETVCELALTESASTLSKTLAKDSSQKTIPLNDYFILGMGKLGGLELNFSSDIDVIAFYRRDTELSPAFANKTTHEVYTKLTEIWAKALTEVTASGFAYRVDLRLRPEGNRGPLVNSVESAQNYYETWGRLWERAAYLKARPIAGNKNLGIHFLRGLEPFIYRRHLDFKVLEEMQRMKEAIREELVARADEGELDIKLGWGGIREIEFFVQTLQLIHGGKESKLRSAHTLSVIRHLQEGSMISEETAEDLSKAYIFLRRTEHLLQIYENRQTHTLPPPGPHFDQVAAFLDFSTPEAFQNAITQQRQQVHALFESLLQESSFKHKSVAGGQVTQTVFQLMAQNFTGKSAFETPGSESANKIEKLSPELVQLLKATAELFEQELKNYPNWRQFLKGLETIFRQIGTRLSFYENWQKSPASVIKLLDLLDKSDFLAEKVFQQVGLLKQLHGRDAPLPVKVDKGIIFKTLGINPDVENSPRSLDLGEAMDALRYFFNEAIFQVGIADLFQRLPLLEAQKRLTAIADLSVEGASRFVLGELEKRHGKPLEKVNGQSAQCAILALGSFGAQELSYTSDLDLVFIYSAEGETSGGTSSGGPITNREFFTLYTQRLISFLSTYTPAGIAYRIDTRLRPSGNAGMLVTSREAFLEYHLKKSQIWEIQALLRARIVHADETLAENLQHDLRQIIFKPYAEAALRQEFHRIRLRVEHERAALPQVKGEGIDLKLGKGGLMDIEFICQYLQLLHGGPMQPHTRLGLAELHNAKHLSTEHFGMLCAAYDLYRYLFNRLCLVCNRNIETVQVGLPRLDEIARTLALDDAKSLLVNLRQQTAGVRKIYLNILGLSE